MVMVSSRSLWSSVALCSSLLARVAAKAILGIDMGSLYMKVALVQRNSPLEIVTNLHSKRKTEVMVLFDNGSRFYGADAFSLLARKPHLTPTQLGVMLGRGPDHPAVKVLSERHCPLTPTYNATRHGPCVSVAGESYTPEELVAMVLHHARDIAAAYSSGAGAVKDCVLTVPSFYTQHERLALRDAATLAGLNVLSLMDENVASALNFGMDRVDEEPRNYLFYNLGAGALQVSVVTYHSYETKQHGKTKRVGSLEVRGKGWDRTLGGAAFDALLVEHMADEFNAVWNQRRGDGLTKDVRDFPRPMTKLRLQAVKAKQVLSANTEIPVYVDALYDDVSYQTTLTRRRLEELSADLLKRAVVPVQMALDAANLTLAEIDAVELVGGGMRVPAVQEALREYLGDETELGMHINSDESMALGAAFRGANVSTAFKVRQVGMTDRNPFAMTVTLTDAPETDDDETDDKKGGLGGLFGVGKKKKKDDVEKDQDSSETEDAESTWSKHATLFKANSKVGIKKTIAFTHGRDVLCSLDYADDDGLPEGTERALGVYSVTGVAAFAAETEQKGLGKPKVSLQFELDDDGVAGVVKAEAVAEETVVVTEEIEEEVPVEETDDDEKEKEKETKDETETETKEETSEETKEETAEETKDDADNVTKDEKEETKEDKKPKTKKVKKTVEKEKKKIHKRALKVVLTRTSDVRPYSDAVMAESKAKLALLDARDRERLLLEEARNKVESYVYKIKNTLVDDEETIAKVTNEEQRESLSAAAAAAEDWMYEDGYDADLATFEAKYDELSGPAEAVFARARELEKRPAAVAALRTKLDKVTELMAKWETDKPQITKEERDDVLARVEEARTWVDDAEKRQADTPPHETPAFTSEEVPGQTKKIEALVTKLNKRPKPKPKEEEKPKTNETADDDNNETTTAEEGETKEEEESKEESTENSEAETEEAKTDDDGAEEEEESAKPETKAEDEL